MKIGGERDTRTLTESGCLRPVDSIDVGISVVMAADVAKKTIVLEVLSFISCQFWDE